MQGTSRGAGIRLALLMSDVPLSTLHSRWQPVAQWLEGNFRNRATSTVSARSVAGSAACWAFQVRQLAAGLIAKLLQLGQQAPHLVYVFSGNLRGALLKDVRRQTQPAVTRSTTSL